MENFAISNQKALLEELEDYKIDEEHTFQNSIGISRQILRENIEGVAQAIAIIKESIKKLNDM